MAGDPISFRDMMKPTENQKEKFVKSAKIEKLDQEALRFDGGRKVDWPFQPRYINNPNMQNNMEQNTYDRIKKLMPEIAQHTVWGDGKNNKEFDYDDIPPTGSRYGGWDIRTVFDDEGKEVLMRTWPSEGAEDYSDEMYENSFQELQDILAKNKDDPRFSHIFEVTTPMIDTPLTKLENAKWIDNNLSENTKDVMDKAGGTVYHTVNPSDESNGAYDPWNMTLILPTGDKALNAAVGGIDTRAHELMHVVFHTMFNIDPELTKITKFRGYKTPMYAGTAHYVRALDRMKDGFGGRDPYVPGEMALGVMRSDLCRGSKKALIEILFAMEALPLYAHGVDRSEIMAKLADMELLKDIPMDFMPHDFNSYYLASGGTNPKSYEPNVIFQWVNEVQSSMAQLEANGDLKKIPWLRPLVPAYNNIIKRAKYLIVRPKNDNEKHLYELVKTEGGDNLQEMSKLHRKWGRIKNIDKLRGESFKQSSSFEDFTSPKENQLRKFIDEP